MSGKLNRKQDALIAALLTEPTHTAAAAKAGVSVATLHRWLQLPAFRTAYRQARRDVVEAAIGTLQQAAGKAVDTLTRNLACGKSSDEIRAALGILDHAVKAVELLDLVERVEQLEAFMQEMGDDANARPGGETAGAGPGDGDQPPADRPESEVPGRDG